MRLLFTADPEIPVPPELYGGVQRLVDSLINEFRSRGHVVGLAAHASSTAKADSFFPFFGESSSSKFNTFRNGLVLRRAVANFSPDIVASFSRIAYMWAILPYGPPKLMCYGREPNRRTTKWGNRLALGTLTFSGCSEHIAETGRRGAGEWHSIPNFIDPTKCRFVPQVSNDAPLVFLSRIEPIKGCHTAISIAKASGRRLLIAGNRVESGSAAGYWDREIAPHLGKNGIEYVGTVNDDQKNKLLGGAAAMVVPIEWEEPFGIVFAESLACGTPVIASPRGAVPEIVKNGVHGFHIRSVDEGVKAVENLNRISRKACRDRVEAEFVLSVVADQYEALFYRLAAAR